MDGHFFYFPEYLVFVNSLFAVSRDRLSQAVEIPNSKADNP